MDPFVLITDRLKREAIDSSSAHCDTLMNACELFIRHITATLIALLPKTEEFESLRYRYVFDLLRSSGIGDWSTKLNDLVVGPHFSSLRDELKDTDLEGCIEELTRSSKEQSDDWKVSVVKTVRSALDYLGEVPNSGKSIRLIEFFNEYPRLRNKMDAHGAPTSTDKANIGKLLEVAVTLLLANLKVLRIPMVKVEIQEYNRSPKIVDVIGDLTHSDRSKIADDLVRATSESGLYVRSKSGAREIALISSNTEISDFYYANGNFNETKEQSEFLSYFSNKKIKFNCKRWALAPKSLPQSMTAGTNHFRIEVSTLTNYPGNVVRGYISRSKLEKELIESLRDSFRRIVTLKGMGGIGKTTLALEIVSQACANRWFDSIIWMSARDIDLHESKSQRVQPDFQTIEDLGKAGIQLFESVGEVIEERDPAVWLNSTLSSDKYGSVLWVLDNLETMRNPNDVVRIIEKCLRPPNQVLITTRHRDFIGDWPIEVKGLERKEFDEMIADYSNQLKTELPKSKVDQIFAESEGHPFVVKLLIAEYKANPRSQSRHVFSRDGLLDDLFERTYARLSDDTQHIFLLLCSFEKPVLELIVNLAVNEINYTPINIEQCVHDLVENSLLESSPIENEYALQVPAVAREFGKRKLKTYEQRVAILAQLETIRMFGSIVVSQHGREGKQNQLTDGTISDSLWRRIQPRLLNEEMSERFLALTKNAARSHPQLWLKLAEYWDQREFLDEARSCYKSYIETGLGGKNQWQKLAQLCMRLKLENESLQSWISAATCSDATLSEISEAANRVNSWLANRTVQFTDAEKRVLIEPLVAVMEPRLDEFDADDCSRLAHLYKKLSRYKDAENVAQIGLGIDPENRHCLKILNY